MKTAWAGRGLVGECHVSAKTPTASGMGVLMSAVNGGMPFAVWHASLSRAWLAFFQINQINQKNQKNQMLGEKPHFLIDGIIDGNDDFF